MNKYLIALGRNIPSNHLTSLEVLKKTLLSISQFEMNVIKVSTWWESKAFPKDVGPNYVNGVVKVSSKLMPQEVLIRLKKIEMIAGRKTSKRWGNRTLDLDLLACGNMILPSRALFMEWFSLPIYLQLKKEPKQLILPHPRIQDRLFVLKPLAEVSPNWVHPVLRKKPKEIMDENVWKPEDFLSPL